MWLLRFAARWRIKTNAMPVSGARAVTNWIYASAGGYKVRKSRRPVPFIGLIRKHSALMLLGRGFCFSFRLLAVARGMVR